VVGFVCDDRDDEPVVAVAELPVCSECTVGCRRGARVVGSREGWGAPVMSGRVVGQGATPAPPSAGCWPCWMLPGWDMIEVVNASAARRALVCWSPALSVRGDAAAVGPHPRPRGHRP
jgi:hypothetical protein